jgi:hypothetical protein
MRGTLLIYTNDGRRIVRKVDGAPTLALLKAAIGGGYLEVVPHWGKIDYDGQLYRCVAFCDEDGKRRGLQI